MLIILKPALLSWELNDIVINLIKIKILFCRLLLPTVLCQISVNSRAGASWRISLCDCISLFFTFIKKSHFRWGFVSNLTKFQYYIWFKDFPLSPAHRLFAPIVWSRKGREEKVGWYLPVSLLSSTFSSHGVGPGTR